MKAIFRLVLLLGLQLLVSAAFILWFRSAYGYRMLIVPLHLAVVGGVLLALTVLAGGLLSFGVLRSSRWSRGLIAVLFGVPGLCLLSLYVVDAVSNRMWGASVTFRLAMVYLPQVASLMHSLPFNEWFAYAGAALLLTGAGFVYWLAAFHLRAGVVAIFAADGCLRLFGSRWRAIPALGVVCAVFVVFGVFMARTVHSTRMFWYGEPIVGLFVEPAALGEDPSKVLVAEEDMRLRAAYPKNLAFKKRNVIILVADSLRSDHMSVYGYERPTTPFLQRLHDAGMLHKAEFCVSTCSESTCGIFSTLSARNFSDLASYNFKINDVLQDQGYKIYYMSADTAKIWYGYQSLFGRGADIFVDGGDSKRYPANDDRIVLEHLEQLPPYSGTPAFLFFVLMSPHMGGVKLPEYEIYKPSKMPLWSVAASEIDWQAMINRYDNGVTQADAYIEKVFGVLEAKGYLQDSIAVIMADHGEGLGERADYGHGEYIYQPNITIPILFYDAPDAPYANLQFASQTDIAPTIADRLGLPIPSCWSGRSLLNPDIKEFTFHSTSYHSGRKNRNNSRAVIYRHEGMLHKYMQWDPEPGKPGRDELYELKSDPMEKVNLIATASPDLVRLLKDKMAEAFRIEVP